MCFSKKYYLLLHRKGKRCHLHQFHYRSQQVGCLHHLHILSKIHLLAQTVFGRPAILGTFLQSLHMKSKRMELHVHPFPGV